MSLKIGVLIKHVPDTNAKIEIKDGAIDESSLKYVLNPYDEFGVEEAVKTKEKWAKDGKEAEIVGVLLGKKEAVKSLRDSFAVGIDRGIHIVDDEKKASDPKAIAKSLAAICKEEGFHLIFSGKQAVDSDSHAVPQMLAEYLGLPHVSVVSKFEVEGSDMATVERDVDGGVKETYKIKMPCLISANKGLNKMRLASLPNIRRASKKEVKEVPLPATEMGFSLSDWTLPPERGAVKMIDGDAATQAKELLRLLREEAKVI